MNPRPDWQSLMRGLASKYTDNQLRKQLEALGASASRENLCRLRNGVAKQPMYSTGAALLTLAGQM